MGAGKGSERTLNIPESEGHPSPALQQNPDAPVYFLCDGASYTFTCLHVHMFTCLLVCSRRDNMQVLK